MPAVSAGGAIGWLRSAVRIAPRRTARGQDENAGPSDNLVDAYPSAAGPAVALFAGNWASRLPVPEVTAGDLLLFEDPRIAWMIGEAGSIAGFDVLELGPLEGAHSAMMLAAGAGSVTGIEANADAFLRCLVVKNLLSLDRATFWLGNFERYLAERPRRFDLILASGILYHLSDPLKVIQDMIAMTDRIGIWSHFYEPEAVAQAYAPPRSNPFTGRSSPRTLESDTLTYHEHDYGATAGSKAFRGGIRQTSSWIEKDALIALFERHGFRVALGHDEAIRPGGPAACLFAQR